MSDIGTNHNVLIVDDEPTTAETLLLIFSHRGYPTKSAHSSKDALRLIADWIPDSALLDVMLPGMDGIALALAIREKCPSCRILRFSGRAETEDLLEEAKREGHDFQILPKPVHPRFLLEAVRRLLPTA